MRQKIPIWIMVITLLPGCVCCKDPLPNPCVVCLEPACDPCNQLVAQVEYPDVERCDQTPTLGSGPPRLLSDGATFDFWEMSLDEAVRLGLYNSTVLKDLGGRVLTSPQAVGSIYDPSITMSHPRLGEEAALAAFDAQYQDLFIYNRANQAFNDATLAGGATVINNDGYVWNSQLSKTAATGTQFSLSQRLEYENSNAPFNLFPSSYTGSLQATVRQPLLQGAGVGFNRIAGPSNQPDLSLTRGVLLARIDGDISVAEFERGVRDFVRDIETAYWTLYFAYRSLDAIRAGRDAARTTWQTVKARNDADLRGGEADQEAQAREQLFLFEQRLVQALNGAPGGGSTGVYQAERTLRRMLGLPVSDDRLIRPADEPAQVPVKFDWYDCLTDALVRRVELRQQMWRVKQRELELLAAKNFLLPRLDAVASFNVNGFGDDLLGSGSNFDSLSKEIASFKFNQSQVGVQLAVPLGYRRELAGVRHAKLNLCRERAVLQDQEHLISHNLAGVFITLETAFDSIRLNQSRLEAAEAVVQSRSAVFETGKVAINFLLESQRRLVDAQLNYYQSRLEYALAMRNLHLEKGTLLPYNGVQLQEGPWPSTACEQAWRERRRWLVSKHQKDTVPCPVALGEYDATLDSAGIAGPSAASGVEQTPRDFELSPPVEQYWHNAPDEQAPVEPLPLPATAQHEATEIESPSRKAAELPGPSTTADPDVVPISVAHEFASLQSEASRFEQEDMVEAVSFLRELLNAAEVPQVNADTDVSGRP